MQLYADVLVRTGVVVIAFGSVLLMFGVVAVAYTNYFCCCLPNALFKK